MRRRFGDGSPSGDDIESLYLPLGGWVNRRPLARLPRRWPRCAAPHPADADFQNPCVRFPVLPAAGIAMLTRVEGVLERKGREVKPDPASR